MNDKTMAINELRAKYDELKSRGLKIDISRGKPCAEQLDISMSMFDAVGAQTAFKSGSFDLRNYGKLDGIDEMKIIFADMLKVAPRNVIIGGESSLNLMYDTVSRAMQFGVNGCTPWNKLSEVKFLCPVPGYDRHFAITEHFGIKMINVEMREDGPDMDAVERLVAEDENIKGIWCVPMYSNPTGYTYSDETVRRFAKLKCKAADFRIYWDNAYAVHHLYEGKRDDLTSILRAAEECGNEDIVYIFASMSKVTFPGAGVACLAAGEANVKEALSHLQYQTIGYNKINMYMHYLLLNNKDNLDKIMMRHADIIRPKFEKFTAAFKREFTSGDISWSEPKGGYFISLNVLPGTAKRVVTLCKECGLILTAAGATFPYGIDPQDRNIRVAPTFTGSDEIDTAVEILTAAVKLAEAEAKKA